MMMKLILNPSLNILCIMLGFAMYITNCYVFKNKKAKVPFKILLVSFMPGLNIVLALMQFCFILPTLINLPSNVLNSVKVSKAVTKLGYSSKKSTNSLPKKA